MTSSPQEVSRLLAASSGGERAALDELIPLVYDELRRLAHIYTGRENPGHTLQTSALVNEAYLRLADQANPRWQNRAHFFAICAGLMRQILVDHARRRRSRKRAGGAQRYRTARRVTNTSLRIRTRPAWYWSAPRSSHCAQERRT